MSRPKLLDLFSCAGGAAVGYHRAGFDVYGVDIEMQPRYPFDFVQADALDILAELLRGERVVIGGEALLLSDFAAVHASPPCQLFSATANAHTKEHVDLLTPVRPLLVRTGLPYVIENVEGAPLMDPLRLCATEFALTANDVDGVPLALRRHRLFESNIWLWGAGGCSHDDSVLVAGVYGGSRHEKPEHRDNPNRRGGYTPALRVRAELLGIGWMKTEHELNQSIPPAYTEHIGRQLLQHIEGVAA